jgi:hypothetical protein
VELCTLAEMLGSSMNMNMHHIDSD